MSDEQKRPGLQRFGRKDRKDRLEPAGDLFPPEESTPDAPQSKPLPFDDVKSETDSVDEALNALSELDKLPLDAYGIPFADDAPPPVSPAVKDGPKPAGAEERFPPVKPEITPDKPSPQPEPARPRRRMAQQDKIALVFMLGTVLLAAWFVIVWNDPQTILNPLAPPTAYQYITTTPLPATAVTNMPPTFAPTASFTPLSAINRVDGQEQATPSPYVFALDESGVLYIPNDNSEGCNWASIAGTVTGMDGAPLNGYGVQVTGDDIDEKVFSGTASTFGAGGFEVFLNGVPQQAQYFVQLFSPTGAPLSDQYTIITSAECDQNVALVNFVQQHEF